MVKKFGIYSNKLKLFFSTYQGKGMYWQDSDFGGLDKIRMYKSESAALEMSMGLLQFDPVVVPIEISADLTSISNVKDIIKIKCKEYLPNVIKIDALDNNAVEKLSMKVWNEYKKQRRYLKEHCEEYK